MENQNKVNIYKRGYPYEIQLYKYIYIYFQCFLIELFVHFNHSSIETTDL